MEIRDAIFNDLQDLLPLAHKAHERSPLAGIPMNDAIMQRNFVVAMTFDSGFAKVIEHNGKVVGGLTGVIAENHCGIRCAQDMFNYSKGGSDKLIKAFKLWAEVRGAQFIQITDLSGNPRYQRLITDLGFAPGGTNFIEKVA